jgi:hypothetical protein
MCPRHACWLLAINANDGTPSPIPSPTVATTPPHNVKRLNYGPRRFWLHTCTKDHPAALPNYLKAGFAVYKEEVKDQG